MGRSEDVEKFVESAGLVGGAAYDFKRRVLLQRAARTFAAEKGDYVVEDKITIPVLSSIELDVRAAIYHGMRMNLSDQRLTNDLRQLGARFILFAECVAHVAQFSFEPEAQPIIDALRDGTSVPELEALHRELDPRLIYAVLGALASCNVINAIGARTPTAQDVSLPRTPTHREPTVSRVPTPRQPTVSSGIAVTVQHTAASTIGPRRAVGSSPAIGRGGFESEPTRMRAAALSPKQIDQLISSRLALLDRGVDLFTFLGVPFGASPAHVRAAYLEIARYLRPERLAELGIHDDRDEARSVFAQAVIAMTVLTDDSRRADYLAHVECRQRAH